MNLKKTLLAAICISACSSAFAQEASNDVSANVQVIGMVNDSESACALSLSTSNLRLRDIDMAALPEQSNQHISKISTDSVAIFLRGDKCKTAGLKFIGTTDNTTRNTLLNSLSSSSAAKGVGIEVYDNNGDPMDFSETISPTWQLYTPTSDYPFYMRMVKLVGETPTMGDVQASLTVQLENL